VGIDIGVHAHPAARGGALPAGFVAASDNGDQGQAKPGGEQQLIRRFFHLCITSDM